MTKILHVLTLLALTSTVVTAAITGSVRDPAGQPLAGIRVTDGFSVTQTAADGAFSLEPKPHSTIISVVVPADKKTDAFWLRLEKGKDSGYAFVLAPRPKRESFTFIQFSDQEESHTPLMHFYHDVRDRALAEDAAFVISTGDLCYEKGIRSAGANMTAATFGGVRAYTTLGNHDLIGEHGTGDVFYEQQCGPTRYAFIEGNVLFIVLPMASGDRKPTYSLDDITLFTKAMLDTWPKGRPVFFACHFYRPYINRTATFAPSSQYAFSLADWKMSGYIYGHSHWYTARPNDPVPSWNTGQSRSGGAGNMPGAMRIFHMDADGNCTTELAESNVQPMLTGLCAPDGTISAVASATSGVFTAVTATVNGTAIPLKKQNSWLWTGRCDTRPDTIAFTASLKRGREQSKLEAAGLADTKALVLERVFPLHGPALFGQPVVADGKIIVGVADEYLSKRGGIVAFDLATGRKAWEYTTGFSVRNSIAEKDGMLYACDADNNVYKLNAADGRLVWSNPDDSTTYDNNCHSAPCLGEGKVFAGCGSALRAIDAESGKTIWKAAGIREVFGTTMGPYYSNGRVLINVNWGYSIHALDAKTGKQLWDTRPVEPKKGFLFQPTLTTLADGTIIRCEGTRGVSVFNPANGELLREMAKSQTLSTSSRPLVADGTIYCGATTAGLCAIDLETLTTKWTLANTIKNSLLATVQYRGCTKLMEASPIMVNGKLVCAGGDGVIYIVNPADGSLIDSYNTGAPLLGTPLYKDGKLYIADYAGRILQFAVKL